MKVKVFTTQGSLEKLAEEVNKFGETAKIIDVKYWQRVRSTQFQYGCSTEQMGFIVTYEE